MVEHVSFGVPSSIEGLTPWIYKADSVNGNNLTVHGNNFATNVEVVIGQWNNGAWQELIRYNVSRLTRGTQQNRQTMAIQVTEQNVINALSQQSASIQVVNTDTNQQSHRLHTAFTNGYTISMGWGSPETISSAGSVEFEYDAVGNRISMEDEVGTVAYQYDELSRLTAETREFTAINNQSFPITYTYEISGQLKTITNPFNATVAYKFDKTSRLIEANGTNYGVSTPFVSNIKYRAWEAVKQADYGYGGQMNINYDARLRSTRYAVTGTANGQQYTRGAEYKYYADGQLKVADDLSNDVFDKFYKYDQVGRLKDALSGFEARGEPQPTNELFPNRPYKQSYQYDAWNNRTGGEHKFWRTDLSLLVQSSYQNNRSPNNSYDADGRELSLSFNAAGRSVEHISLDIVGGYPSNDPIQPEFEIRQKFDGNGSIGRREVVTRQDVTENGQTTVETNTNLVYYVRSTVLGGKPVVEVGQNGNQTDGYVYMAGALLAKQYNLCPNCPKSVIWQEANPLTGSRYEVSEGGSGELQERDPLGANTGLSDPWETFDNPRYFDLPGVAEQPFTEIGAGSNPFSPSGGCELNGLPYNCNQLQHEADMGSAVGEAHSGGRLIGFNIPLAGAISVNRGYVSVNLPDSTFDIMHDFKDGNGLQVYPQIKRGDVYFIETAVSSGGDEKIEIERGKINTSVIPRPLTCIFNINLVVPQKWQNTDYTRMVPDDLIPGEFISEAGFLYRLKHEMMGKFERAGAFLTFNNETAAAGTRRGSYNLKFTEKLSGLTAIEGILEPNALGFSFRDNGQVNITKVGESVPDLANVGTHETGHWILGNYPGNDRTGHSEEIMRAFYDGMNKVYPDFSPEQARFLSSLCNENKP